MSWISIGVLCCANKSNCYKTLEIQMKPSPLIYSPLEAINSDQTNVKSTAKQFITSSFFGAHSVTESLNPVMWFSDTATQTIPSASNKINDQRLLKTAFCAFTLKLLRKRNPQEPFSTSPQNSSTTTAQPFLCQKCC